MTDLSDEMMRLAEARFNDPNTHYLDLEGTACKFFKDFVVPPGVATFNILEERKKYVKDDSDKLVFGCLAVNE